MEGCLSCTNTILFYFFYLFVYFWLMFWPMLVWNSMATFFQMMPSYDCKIHNFTKKPRNNVILSADVQILLLICISFYLFSTTFFLFVEQSWGLLMLWKDWSSWSCYTICCFSFITDLLNKALFYMIWFSLIGISLCTEIFSFACFLHFLVRSHLK